MKPSATTGIQRHDEEQPLLRSLQYEEEDGNDGSSSTYSPQSTYFHKTKDDAAEASHVADLARMATRRREGAKRMRTLTFFAAVGGFLSGYNCGVLSGALLPLKRVFHLSSEQEEAIVSSTILSAFVASITGGTINPYLGRRKTLILAAAIFTLGGLVLFTAMNYASLVVGEILLGSGIGLESLTSPLYIAEVAKPTHRGMLVSMYALMMCLGQFFAGIMDGVFGAVLPDTWGWRFMFGCSCIPGMVMFSGFLTLPESPSWLMAHSEQKEEARIILTSVRDTDQEVALELQQLRNTTRTTEHQTRHSSSVLSSFRQIMGDEPTRNALVVGCGLMVLQQICGVNALMYYAASIYQSAGFEELTSIWLSAFTTFAQIVGLAFSVFLVERKGRRFLVISSFVCVGLCSLGLGWSFYGARIGSEPIFWDRVDPECARQAALVWDGYIQNCYDCVSIPGCGYIGNSCVVGDSSGPAFLFDNSISSYHNTIMTPADILDDWTYDKCNNSYSWMSILFMVIYLIVFGIGATNIPWTNNSEIYPVRYRSLAVSISTGTNWLSNLLVSSTFLIISSPTVLTSYGSFWMYAVICFLGAAWLYCCLPETKGLSLEEIEQAFSNRKGETFPRILPEEQERLLAVVPKQPRINRHDGTFCTSYCNYEKEANRGDETVTTCGEESASSSVAGSVRVEECVSSDDEA